MRKLFKISIYFFILNLLFGNSQTKEIESTQTLVLKVEKITLLKQKTSRKQYPSGLEIKGYVNTNRITAYPIYNGGN